MKIQNIINVALAICVTALIYQNIQLKDQMEKQKRNLQNSIYDVETIAIGNGRAISKNERELNTLGYDVLSNDSDIMRVDGKTKSNERKIRLLEVQYDGLELRLDIRN